MENEKKVGRPKKKVSRDIKLTVRVTKEENKKLEIIAKKLGISKPELLRTFTLGTDNKAPDDIYMHKSEFYPFTRGYNSWWKEFNNHREENNIDLIDLTNFKQSHLMSYEEYKHEYQETELINKYSNIYQQLDIKGCDITTINDLFGEKTATKILFYGYDIDKYINNKENWEFIYQNKTYSCIQLKEYFLNNIDEFKDIKDYSKDKNIVILYGRNRKVLKVIPYIEE